jgi:hypothetical protein
MALTYAEQKEKDDAEALKEYKRRKEAPTEADKRKKSPSASQAELGLLSHALGLPADLLLGLLAPQSTRPGPEDMPPGTSEWWRKQIRNQGFYGDVPEQPTGAEGAGGLLGDFSPIGKAVAGVKALGPALKGLLSAGIIPAVKGGLKAVAPEAKLVYRGGSPGAVATEGGEAGTRQYGPGAYFGGKGTAEDIAKFRDKGEVKGYHLGLQQPFDETRQWVAPKEQMDDLRSRLTALGVPEQHVRELDTPYRGALNNLAAQLGKVRGISQWKAADEINAALRESKFDGIIADAGGGGEQYVAFNPGSFREAGARAPEEVRSLLDAGSTGAGAAPSAQGPVSGLIDIPQSRLIMPTALSTDAIQRFGQQTVRNPKRNMYPGVYGDPREMVRAVRVDPESPYLRYLFNVGRDDIAEIGQYGRRQGNTFTGDEFPFKTAKNPKGSGPMQDLMVPENARRLQDLIGETMKRPELYHPMANWYVMDPAYWEIVKLVGEDAAPQIYARFNSLTGMASPSSDVLKEWNRGTGAHWLANEGRWQDFKRYGKRSGMPGQPEDMIDIQGHPHHKTAHAGPMEKYLERGEVDMGSAKVPTYLEASGVPETGFQTRWSVGDAHLARIAGMADVRGVASGKSASVPEMVDFAPWFREEVAKPMRIESVPGQGTVWGAGSGATGVESPLGAGKLELLAMSMGKRAEREGIDAKHVRDAVLLGLTHSGQVTPEMAAILGAGSTTGLLGNWWMQQQQKKAEDDLQYYQPMQ